MFAENGRNTLMDFALRDKKHRCIAALHVLGAPANDQQALYELWKTATGAQPNRDVDLPQFDDALLVRHLEHGAAGGDKWSGIAAARGKLSCAPSCATSVLVIDAETETTRLLECGGERLCGGLNKWDGIAAAGGKLFCAPANASSVLVIDAETETTRLVECCPELGAAGDGAAHTKWY
jgi:hypothetical protein